MALLYPRLSGAPEHIVILLYPRLSGAPEHIVILFIINKLPSLHDLAVSETINDKIAHLDSLAVSLYAPVLEFMRVFIFSNQHLRYCDEYL